MADDRVQNGPRQYFLDRVVLSAAHWLELWDVAWRQRGLREEGEKAPSEAIRPGVVASGRYRLEALLGEGGMGRVWLAEDTLERRQVALKEMRLASDAASAVAGGVQSAEAATAGDGVDVAFRREFYTMSKLQHPNTVKVYDYGQLITGDRFITMEVVKGADLASLVQRGPLPLRQVYRILIDLCHVLGFIHSRAFVHCDIKTENIRLTDKGAVKLMDFGLMHPLGTPANGLKGSPHYLAPEIAQGQILDGRTDLYALGVLAFELTTGRYPFDASALGDLIGQHLHKPPPKLASFRSVPDAFEQWVQKLLAKQPQDRPNSAAEVLASLGKIAGISVELKDYESQTSYLRSVELVGRASEMDVLRRALSQALEGTGSSYLLVGAAGMGKSRLIQELQLSVKLSDVPCLTAYCRSEGQAPLGPVVELLQQWVALAPAESMAAQGPVLVRILPQLADRGFTPAPAPPGAEKVVVFEAVRQLLRDTSAKTPLVLCLEDVQAADASTLELWNVIIRAATPGRCLVVTTLRSDEADRLSLAYQTVDEGVTRRLELQPLPEEGTRSLLHGMLKGGELSAEFDAHLHTATAGNPFLVTETLRALMEKQSLQLIGNTWTLQDSTVRWFQRVEEVATERATLLPEDLRALADVLAPLGRVLELPLVRAIAGLDDAALFSRLDALVERQFLTRINREYYFTNDPVRRALYDATDPSRRKALHQRIGLALERQAGAPASGKVSQLAFHFARGEDDERAIRYLRLAGDQALASNAQLEGLQLLAQAADRLEAREPGRPSVLLLELWDRLVQVGFAAHPPTLVRIADKLLPVLEQRIGGDTALAQFQAKDQALRAGRGWFAQRRLAGLWSEKPFDARAKASLRWVPYVFMVRSVQAFSAGVTGNAARAKEIVDRQLEQHPHPGPFRATAQISRSVGLFQMGLWAVQQREARESQAWFEAHLSTVGVMPQRLHWYYVATLYWQVIGQARMGLEPDATLLAQGQALAAQHGFGDWKFLLEQVHLMRAALVGDETQWKAAIGPLEAQLARLGNPLTLRSRVSALVVEYFVVRRAKEQAEAAVSRLEKVAGASNDEWMRRHATALRAVHSANVAPPAQALGVNDDALAAARGVPSFFRFGAILAARCSVLVKLGRKDEALKTAEDAYARATQGPTANILDEVLALRALAEALEGVAAVDRATEAVAAARRSGLLIEEAHSQVVLAERVLAISRGRAAEAIEAAEGLGRSLQCAAVEAKAEEFRRKVARG